MANYDVETRMPDVLVHITYPDNKTKNITITGYAIHKRPRCKIDGMKDCRKLAKTIDDIPVIVDRVVNAIVDKYQNKDKKVFISSSGFTSISVAAGNSKYDSRNDCNALIETGRDSLIVGCQNIVVHDGVSRIDSYAFFGRKGLTSIAIPESVRYIFDYAFTYCDNLASLTVPDTVESIGGRSVPRHTSHRIPWLIWDR